LPFRISALFRISGTTPGNRRPKTAPELWSFVLKIFDPDVAPGRIIQKFT
jgi:hypothetical protein